MPGGIADFQNARLGEIFGGTLFEQLQNQLAAFDGGLNKIIRCFRPRTNGKKQNDGNGKQGVPTGTGAS
jgi:hypothetical protein